MIYDANQILEDLSPSWQSGTFFVGIGDSFTSYVAQTRFANSDYQFGGTDQNPSVNAAIGTILADQGQFGNHMTQTFMTKGKCRDTQLGGSDVINPLPQYCEYDDIPMEDNGLNGGADPMGRVYSTNFDDNYFILWMSFGIPIFNNLAAFYKNAINDSAATIANKGVAYVAAEAIGELLAAPTALFIKAPIMAFDWATRVLEMTDAPITRYYDFQSQMPMYYRYVNALLLKIGVNLGFLNAPDSYSNYNDQRDALKNYNSQTGTTNSNSQTTGGSGTAQTQQQSNSTSALEIEPGTPEYISQLQLDVCQILHRRMMYTYGANVVDPKLMSTNGLLGAAGAPNKDFSLVGTLINAASSVYNGLTSNTADQADSQQQTDKQGNAIPDNTSTSTSTDNRPTFVKNVIDGLKIGAHPEIYLPLYYIGVRVERGAAVSETISNEFGDSSIKSTLNSYIQNFRDGAFSLANGNIVNIPGVSAALGGILGAAKGLVSGAANMLGVSGLTALATGAGIIDIPMEYKNSSFARDYHFQVTLNAESGDDLTILQSVFYPFAFLLTAALPRGTGDASWTSPFLCKSYCKGVMSVPLGGIERMTITRGDDVYGYSVNRLPMKMIIDFTIRDLSGVMYMAYDSSTSAEALLIGNNSTYSEYIDTITAMDWNQRFGITAQIRRWRTFRAMLLHNKLNPTLMGMGLGSNKLFRLFNAVTGAVGTVPTDYANPTRSAPPAASNR